MIEYFIQSVIEIMLFPVGFIKVVEFFRLKNLNFVVFKKQRHNNKRLFLEMLMKHQN
jgi:hypothetical protein